MTRTLPAMSFRRRLLLAGLLPLVAGPLALAAQDTPARTPAPQPGTPEVIELEEFQVTTGSNIRRAMDEETALPVTVLDFTDLEGIDASTAVELFEYLPEAGFSDMNEEATGGADARGDVAAINLRGIGSRNTLVLLNGRRIAPHPISQAVGRVPGLSVNINTLPTTIVRRVEVLRDGASAVYGADAAAGVLNTITRTDYNRTHTTFRVQLPEKTGGDETRFTLSRGDTFNEGRTYFAWAYNRFQRQELMLRDRGYSENQDTRTKAPPPWTGHAYEFINPDTGEISTYRDNDFDNRSSVTRYGHFIVGTFNAQGQFIGIRPSTGINTSTSTFGGLQARVSSTSGGFYITPVQEVDPETGANIGFKSDNNVPSRIPDDDPATRGQNEYYFSQGEWRHILPRTLRHSFYAVGTHKFGNGLELFGDLLAYHAKSTSFREPLGIESTGTPNAHVPASNYWNPFGVRFYHPTGEPNADGTPRNIGTPRDLLFAEGHGIRLMDLGGRIIDVTSRSGRGVLGLRGQMFHTWQWESALNYSFAKTRDLEHNSVRESRLIEAMARTDETAFNPFGRTFKNVQVATTGTNQYRIYVDEDYQNPAAIVDEVRDSFERIGRTSLFTWDLKADGDVVHNWAGAIKAAAGVEYRYETYEDWRPPFHGLNPDWAIAERPDLFREMDNDFAGLSPNANIDVSRNVMSAYVETLIPLVAPRQRVPLVRSLELSAALRYETFSEFGDVLAPKISLSYNPVPWAMLRASYNESFGAPNLVQTNPDPIRRIVSGIQDYYRQGIPGAVDSGSRNRLVYRGGNPDLKPETADNLLLGIVVEPPFLKNFSFSLDHFRLNQRDVIDAPTGTQNTRLDEEILSAVAASQVAAGVPLNQLSAYRTEADGSQTYLGNPFVNRHPPTPSDLAAFMTYNLNLPPGTLPKVPVGQIESIVNNYRNIAGRDLSGFDFSARWRSDRTRLGRLIWRMRGTYITRFDEIIADDEDAFLGTDNRWKNNNSKWRGNMSLTWRFANMSTGISTYYRGSTLETSANMGVTGATPEFFQARWDALGRPTYIVPTLLPTGQLRYYYKVPGWMYHNVFFRYNFRQRQGWLQGAHIRLGIVNVGDSDPAFADLIRGFRGGSSLSRGRTYNVTIGKRF